MAWYAVFRLLASSDPAPVAQLRDFLIAVALCCLVFVPSTRMIWVAALGVVILCWLFSGGDRKLRAAGIVFAALSVQELWGRIFFDLFALPLLRAETAVVGTMLRAVRAGTEWRDNVISGPSGHGIVVYDYCSSFHNLSVAVLCWVTVRSLQDRSWQVRDFVTGCVLGMTMVLFNMTRLCLMAWDANLYHYWHDGVGVQIFDIGASTTILLMSLYGSRSAERAADALVDSGSLEPAVLRVARSHDWGLGEHRTTSGVPTLVFEAPGCSQPVFVSLRLSSFEEETIMQYAPEPGHVRRYIYFDRTWDTPDPRAAFLQRMKYALLAMFGMTEYEPSRYLLLVEAPPHCHAAETIDWRPVWSRDTLAAEQANAHATATYQ